MGQLRRFKFITFGTIVLAGAYLGLIALAGQTQEEPKPKARKFDAFRFVTISDMQARLDNLAIQLQNEPSATTYIKFYSGRREPPARVQGQAESAKDYLVNRRGIESARITTYNAGPDRNSSIELWIVPAGAAPPI